VEEPRLGSTESNSLPGGFGSLQMLPDITTHYGLEPERIKATQEILDRYGVCVLTGFLTDAQSRKYAEEVVEWFLKRCTDGVTHDPDTWKTTKLPSNLHGALYQVLVGHAPRIWKLREKLYPLFVGLWDEEDLITSIDGATITPPIIRRSKGDWAHIDQTELEPDTVCYQGQVVLTDTTACFRCTPGSHLIHDRILEICGVEPNPSNWLKLSEDQQKQVQRLVQKLGGDWQIPIWAPRGSVILWRSNTIHSAQHCIRLPTEEQVLKDKLAGWMVKAYVCMRPRKLFTKRNLTTIRRAAQEGRITNHWGTKMFPKSGRFSKGKSVKVQKIMIDCKKLSYVSRMTPTMKRLVGLTKE